MEFSFPKWDVKLIQKPEELMKVLKSFKFTDKRIVKISCIGHCFNFEEEEIEESAYLYYENDKKVIDLHKISSYENIPDDTSFGRWVEIDEPIIFEFETGERLEIDYSEGSTVKVGLNSISDEILSDYQNNKTNADLNIVFSNCIGQMVEGFDIVMQDRYPIFTGSYGIELSEHLSSYIGGIEIRLYSGDCILINSWHSFCHVAYNERPDCFSSTILWKDLKKGINNN